MLFCDNVVLPQACMRCAAMGAAVRYAAFVAEWLATCKYNIHCNNKFSPSDTENTLSLL